MNRDDHDLVLTKVTVNDGDDDENARVEGQLNPLGSFYVQTL